VIIKETKYQINKNLTQTLPKLYKKYLTNLITYVIIKV